MGYFIEYSGLMTLHRYSDVYGDVVRLEVKGRTSSLVDTGLGSVKKDFEEYRRASSISAFLAVIYLAIEYYCVGLVCTSCWWR